MGYVLNLQGTARSADADGNGALSIVRWGLEVLPPLLQPYFTR